MKKVLIVDDEEAILKMYSVVLQDEFEVITAHNGNEGFETAKREKPDLIYLDIIMPQLNGLDVLGKLKDDKETTTIPVVLLTNLPKEASADKAKALGAADYFVKVETEPSKIAEITKQILG
ncbi:MAG: response regulator [Patescibacteria group bacterium]|jgi:PleD family two-component response regulator